MIIVEKACDVIALLNKLNTQQKRLLIKGGYSKRKGETESHPVYHFISNIREGTIGDEDVIILELFK